MQWLFDILQRLFFPLKELDGRWSDIDDDGMNLGLVPCFEMQKSVS